MSVGKAFHMLSSLFVIVVVLPTLAQAQAAKKLPAMPTSVFDLAVRLTAKVEAKPPCIHLDWSAEETKGVTGYEVRKRLPQDRVWGPPVALPPSARGYSDPNCQAGFVYEYQVVKFYTQDAKDYGPTKFTGYGYIWTGIDIPLVDRRGAVVLIVDETHAKALSAEIAQLEDDLVGDGWQVIRHDVSPQDTPPKVKALIQADYGATPNVQAVLLLGHVPVPYSGGANIGHVGERGGTYATDCYYADLDGTWTDTAVNFKSGPHNNNVPGDGRFDQGTLPSDAEVAVGRVDMYDLPAFGASEQELLGQYLKKDHQYRMGAVKVDMRAVLENTLKIAHEVSATATRNPPSMVGAKNIELAKFNTLERDSALWGFAYGGSLVYDQIGGVLATNRLAKTPYHVIFCALNASHIANWNTRNNIYRAMLANTGPCLTCQCAWDTVDYHPMGMGQTIGWCLRLSLNNKGVYKVARNDKRQYGNIILSLMGDPTLRLYPVPPPTDLKLSATGGAMQLSWRGSSDKTVIGYHVYRSPSRQGSYERLTNKPVTDLSYQDKQAFKAGVTYMVRAVKLQESPSGTYYDASLGAMIQADESKAP